MKSILTILTIARFEAKVLFRSWFFRIFSMLSLGILMLLNIAFFANPDAKWMFFGIPSGIPYMSLILLNLAQALLGGFLGSDFLKYDQRLDTTDVIYMRSMTNAEYVLGKVLGILIIFGGLNFVALGFSFVSNYFFTDVPVVWAVYGMYPLLISLPTLLFVLGLTFFFMTIFRNQAVTFIILLGMAIITFFFTGQSYNYLFDYLTFDIPMMYSGFVGFGNLDKLLMHRGMYFLFGSGLIFTTILLLRRLAQSRIMNGFALIGAVACFIGALSLGYLYLGLQQQGMDLRSDMRELNAKIVQMPSVSMQTCNLDVTHNGESITVSAALQFTNHTDAPIAQYIFSLNPGLEISRAFRGDQELTFQRDLHVFTVTPQRPLQAGGTDELTVEYEGVIDENACYIDIHEDTRAEGYKLALYNVDKRYSFITSDYVLLTPENLWYPVAGLPMSMAYPALNSMDFIQFHLQVHTGDGLTAISQGAVQADAPGEYSFQPEVPLPQITLAIGDYENKTVRIDETDYSIYYLAGHDFFSEHFDGVTEEIPELISTFRASHEAKLEREYPYRRLTLIETPIQLYTYPRLWTMSTETVQPEQVLLPEKGVLLSTADFRRYARYENKGMQRGKNTVSPEEIKKNLFRRFVRSTFLEGDSHYSMIQSMRRSRGGFLSSRMMSFMGGGGIRSHGVLPMFYSYVHHFSSDRWPIFNTMMEYHFLGKVSSNKSMFARMMMGLSSEEQANLVLQKQSLADIVTQSDAKVDIPGILQLKCDYLFDLMQREMDEEAFLTFLNLYLDVHQFTDMEVEGYLNAMTDLFGENLSPQLDAWLHEERLPAFIVSDPECYEILEDNHTRYQVLFDVSNPEPAAGLIEVIFRTSGRGGGAGMRGGGRDSGRGFGDSRGGGMGTGEKQVVFVEGGQSIRVGIVMDEQPRMMTVNTLVSQNIPSSLNMVFGRPVVDDNLQAFDGELVYDTLLPYQLPGEIVVDNEDPGFTVHSMVAAGYLKKLFALSDAETDRYIGMRTRGMPRKWSATTTGDYYGVYRHSGHYIRGGRGKNSVSWQVDIPEAGMYDVYFYVPEIRNPMDRSRGGGQQPSGQRPSSGQRSGGPGGQRGGAPGGQRAGGGSGGRPGQGRGDQKRDPIAEDFHFTVQREGGAEEVELDVDDVEYGWLFLGAYHYGIGSYTLELSDQTRGRMVYADAMKWVKNEQ